RFHLCWGSWHGPHVTDIAMRDIVEVLLAVDVQAYSFEAGNVRHEHEWKVWREVKLPDDKLILPGVVSHATNVVEHPELVAERILRFAKLVGRERVIASTDCGLGGRIHPDIAWAKLDALAQGAALASRQLKAAGLEEGFMTSVAPGSAYRIPNAYYKSDEEFLYACAEAMREEYKAILDAGLALQLDDPATATGWDMIDPEPSVEDYKKFTMVRVEALNYALRDLPQERIRFHLCWGSWHGPHTTDIPM